MNAARGIASAGGGLVSAGGPSGRVAVVGGINRDHVAKGARLPGPGESVAGDLFEESPGGKGANQAVAVRRYGRTALLVGKVGDDEPGHELIETLRREGVDVIRVAWDADAPTGAAVITVDGRGEKQIMAVPGANGRLTEKDVEAAADELRCAAVLLAQLEVPVEAVRRALELARGAGVTTVLDPAPAAPLDDDLLRLVDVIRPNASEAAALTGVEVHDRASARRAADALLRRGTGAACVQAGPEGDLLVTPRGEVFLPRYEVPSVDATGAGDAFAGVMAAALAEGRPLAAAAAFGSAAAALATTKLGAQAGLPHRDEILRLLGRLA